MLFTINTYVLSTFLDTQNSFTRNNRKQTPLKNVCELILLKMISLRKFEIDEHFVGVLFFDSCRILPVNPQFVSFSSYFP